MKATAWSVRLGCGTLGGGTWRIGAAVWALVAVCAGLATPARAGSYGNVVLSDSPFLYWPLDETSGTTVYDAAGTRNGTVSGSINLAGLGPRPAAFGGFAADNTGAEFTGLGDGDEYIRNNIGNVIGAEYTLEGWFKVDAGEGGAIVALSNFNSYQRYRHLNVNSGNGKLYGFQRNGDAGTVTLTDGESSTSNRIQFDTGVVVNDGNWHYVAAVFSADTGDGDGNASTGYRLQVWLDPTSTAPTCTFYHNGGDIIESHFWAGASQNSNGGVNTEFAGQLDEIALYNAALTGEQVLSHYTAGIGAATGTIILIN